MIAPHFTCILGVIKLNFVIQELLPIRFPSFNYAEITTKYWVNCQRMPIKFSFVLQLLFKIIYTCILGVILFLKINIRSRNRNVAKSDYEIDTPGKHCIIWGNVPVICLFEMISHKDYRADWNFTCKFQVSFSSFKFLFLQIMAHPLKGMAPKYLQEHQIY